MIAFLGNLRELLYLICCVFSVMVHEGRLQRLSTFCSASKNIVLSVMCVYYIWIQTQSDSICLQVDDIIGHVTGAQYLSGVVFTLAITQSKVIFI